MVKCPSHHIIACLHAINVIYDSDVDLDHVAEVVFVTFSTVKIHFSPPFHAVSFGKKSLCTAGIYAALSENKVST